MAEVPFEIYARRYRVWTSGGYLARQNSFFDGAYWRSLPCSYMRCERENEKAEYFFALLRLCRGDNRGGVCRWHGGKPHASYERLGLRQYAGQRVGANLPALFVFVVSALRADLLRGGANGAKKRKSSVNFRWGAIY